MQDSRIVRLAIFALFLVSGSRPSCGLSLPYGQNADSGSATETFAVASIRRNLKPTYMRLQFTINGLVAEGVTLRQLIQMAYGLFGYDRLIGEPEWVDFDYFNVEARIDDSLADRFADFTLDQRRRMLQSLLADRFGLIVHRAKAERPVYDLVVAKGGPKLKLTEPQEVSHSAIKGVEGMIVHGDRGHLEVQGFSMNALATHLEVEKIVDRPVVNRTGLTGYYTFSLHWIPGDRLGRRNQGSNDPQDELVPSDPPGVSTIFSEIQKQLGLRLQQSKGQVDVLVFDHARPPTEN